MAPRPCSGRATPDRLDKMSVGAVNIRDAYAHCEQITATQARNFSYGIRLLPGPKRRAMSALYATARRIDDI
ncbi:MAG TPA: squalene/phytoene synthase family protein, partial [Acidimicrobiales bacterium]|nr:squalene/phytoene synthase family protein [Acidimicrobiales bacterium]